VRFSVEGALVVLAIISGLTIAAAVFVAFKKGGFPAGLKPVRLNVIYLFTVSTLLLVFISLRGFDWLNGFVPDTDWWDGATFMGTIVLGLSVIFGLIAILQALVNSVTTEPEDKPEAMVPKSVFIEGIRAARGNGESYGGTVDTRPDRKE
jgi:uncharacterized BrkB/YihY/UPF0761 family membrane protein